MARSTGALYLLIIVCGIFSEAYVRSGLIVRGDATTTAANIVASETLFRVGFASDVLVFLADVAVAVLLYFLLRPVSHVLSMIAAAFQLVGTAIYGVNLLNHLAALLLLGGARYLDALAPPARDAMALFFLDVHQNGYDLGLVFFGLHCAVLGYLLWRSPSFPGVLGVLMVLASIGYLVGSFVRFLAPQFAELVQPIYVAPLVGELALCSWLLVKGVRQT